MLTLIFRRYSSNITGFVDYLQNLTTRFPHSGGVQAEYKLSCWTWPSKLRTKWRFDGPWSGNVPILFTNNRLDPVTPLKNAKKMSVNFNGSRVLVQDNVGHGALFPTAPGASCVWEHVKRYMDSGEMPDEGTICEFPCKPFDEGCVESLEATKYFMM
jgi:pimeloyl-ACP methyl ester carboxylesterase